MDTWIEISVGGEKHRHPLSPRGVRIGGEDCALQVPEPAGDALVLMGSPPRVKLEGGSTTPLLNGRVFEEATLQSGDAIQWGGAVLVIGGSAVLEEIEEVSTPAPAASAASAPNSAGGASSGNVEAPEGLQRIGRRMAAGLAAELGLADKKAVKRWQEAVISGGFQADACASELLTEDLTEDKRIIERAGRFQRDLLMTSLQRGAQGAKRKVRQAAKGGAGFLVAQLLVVGIITLILGVIVILARVKWDISVDDWIDGLLGGIGLGKG